MKESGRVKEVSTVHVTVSTGERGFILILHISELCMKETPRRITVTSSLNGQCHEMEIFLKV